MSTPHAKTVDASKGADWIGSGFTLFKADAGTWLLITVVWLVMAIVSEVIPFVGSLVWSLFTPVFAGGLMLACQALRNGKPISIDYLFAGFKAPHLSPLLVIGTVVLAVQMVLKFTIGMSVIGMLHELRAGSAINAVWGIGGIFSVLVGIALFFAMMMATWFAPALVVIDGVAPVDALKGSFSGSSHNIGAFLVYGALSLVIAIVASIPLMLGWLVAWPVLTASAYAGYRSVFAE